MGCHISAVVAQNSKQRRSGHQLEQERLTVRLNNSGSKCVTFPISQLWLEQKQRRGKQRCQRGRLILSSQSIKRTSSLITELSFGGKVHVFAHGETLK